MEKIKLFLLEFIKAEYLAKRLSLLPDIAKFNEQLGIMDDFLVESLKSQFGMIQLEQPKRPAFYEKFAKFEPPAERYLFRIDKIGTVNPHYRAFLSDLGDIKWYLDCLVLSEINGQLIITSRFTWGEGRDGSTEKHWYFSGGEKLEYSDLSPVTETLRLLAPEDDEACMKQYLS